MIHIVNTNIWEKFGDNCYFSLRNVYQSPNREHYKLLSESFIFLAESSV